MLVCWQQSARQGVNIVFRQPLSYRTALMGISMFAVATMLTTPLQATTARVHSLGGGEFIEDQHNVQRWYGSLGDIPNLITFESGHFTLPKGWHTNDGQRISGPGLGIHLALDQARRWGTVAMFMNGHGDDVDPGSLGRSGLGTTWSAMWSRRFGALQPALMFRRGSDADTKPVAEAISSSPIRSWDRSRTEYGLGLRWDLNETAYLDLAGELRAHSEQTNVADQSITVPGPEVTSTGSIGLRSRAFIRLNQTLALVPLVEYLHEDRPTFAPSPIVATSLQGHLLKIGTGLNWYPDADHFMIVGVDYVNADLDYRETPLSADQLVTSTRRWDSFSLTMGFESRFRHWLTFRGSIRYEAVNLDQVSAEVPRDFATFMLNLGAAVQLGGFDLDLALTDEEPRSVAGYYGNTLFNNSATWLTVSLRWNWTP